MGALLNFRSMVIVLILCTVASLGVLGAKGSATGDSGNISDAQMMKKLANSPGAFVFVDLEAMRADADLEDVYDALERDVEVWIEPLDMDFDEADRMGLGGRVAAFEGLFSLEQMRCKLKANGFVRTKYRGVETWEKDNGEIITCPKGGLLSWLSFPEFESLCDNPCFRPSSCEEAAEDDAGPDCGYVDCVALMSSRSTFHRGHETVLTGHRDWVRDSIGVVKYGDASIYDDSDFRGITSFLPGGVAIRYQKDRFLDLYEYEGLEVSGVSMWKRDQDTLGLKAVCRFGNAESASNAVESLKSDLQNDAFKRWRNVTVRSDGELALASFETDIALRAMVDLAPPCITGVTVAGTSMTSAIITWTTSEPATSRVEYGETETLEAAPVIDGGLMTSHAVRLDSLLPDTEYYFRVVSVDASGSDTASPVQQFRTLGEFPPDAYSIVDDNGRAALLVILSKIQLDPTTGLELTLTDPTGVAVGRDSVNPGDTEAILAMAGPGVSPGAGTYTLSFADGAGRQIVWAEFAFLEVQAAIPEVTLDWKYVTYAGRYTLYGISFMVENSGEIPVYLDKVEVTLGTLSFEMPVGQMVVPGQNKTVERSTYITNIAPGSKRLTLRFVDETGEVRYTHTSTVVPS